MKIYCPNCENKCSEEAASCPNCGHRLKALPWVWWRATSVPNLLAVAGGFICIGGIATALTAWERVTETGTNEQLWAGISKFFWGVITIAAAQGLRVLMYMGIVLARDSGQEKRIGFLKKILDKADSAVKNPADNQGATASAPAKDNES